MNWLMSAARRHLVFAKCALVRGDVLRAEQELRRVSLIKKTIELLQEVLNGRDSRCDH